jgi:hypothetical protein
MKRTFAALIAALSACGGAHLTAEEARSAVPSASQAALGEPAGTTAAGAALTATAVAAPGPATAAYASDTIRLARAVNGGVAWTLGALERVVALPPTACAGDTCTWGPWTGPFEVNAWQLTVTRVDDHYAWAFAGQPRTDAAAAFVTFVAGNAWTTGVRHVGHGDFALDLDAAARLARRTDDPAPQRGRIEVRYDNRAAAQVGVTFLGTDDDAAPGTRVNAAYAFTAAAAGGDLQVATRNLTSGAALTLHSRWTATGAGRGDATFSDGAGATYARSQCWAGAARLFDLVFQVTAPPQASDAGAESACAPFLAAEPPALAAP